MMFSNWSACSMATAFRPSPPAPITTNGSLVGTGMALRMAA